MGGGLAVAAAAVGLLFAIGSKPAPVRQLRTEQDELLTPEQVRRVTQMTIEAIAQLEAAMVEAAKKTRGPVRRRRAIKRARRRAQRARQRALRSIPRMTRRSLGGGLANLVKDSGALELLGMKSSTAAQVLGS